MSRSYLFFLFLLTSCVDIEPGEPPINLDEFKVVVADVQLAEALSAEVPVLVRDSLKKVYFERTLADHGLDQASFDSLMWLVRQEPEWIDSLFSGVSTELLRRQAEQ